MAFIRHRGLFAQAQELALGLLLLFCQGVNLLRVAVLQVGNLLISLPHLESRNDGQAAG